MPSRKPIPARKSRSGPYVREAQRGTVRVRLPREDHERASLIADRSGREVVEVIADAIRRMPMPRPPRVMSADQAGREVEIDRGDREYERMRDDDIREGR